MEQDSEKFQELFQQATNIRKEYKFAENGFGTKEELIQDTMNQLVERDKNKKQNLKDIENRISEFLTVITSIANLKFDEKIPISGDDMVLDAIANGINMLGEELEHSAVSITEKETLLKEVHHRVKNNLQIITSLLHLQASYVQDEETKSIFSECCNRVRSMALVHTHLYTSGQIDNLDLQDYFETLLAELVQGYYHISGNININVNVEDSIRFIDLNAIIPCGLIVNELATNSCKYAFKQDQKDKRLELTLKRSKAPNFDFHLQMKDNGVGISGQDYLKEENETMGKLLVQSLIEQLRGELSVTLKDGVCYDIDFKHQL